MANDLVVIADKLYGLKIRFLSDGRMYWVRAFNEGNSELRAFQEQYEKENTEGQPSAGYAFIHFLQELEKFRARRKRKAKR